MNKRIRMPILVGLLSLALVLAACDRPSATNAISSPAANTAQDVPTQSPDEIAAQQTQEASGQNNEPNAAATGTPIPAANPNPTAVPVPTQSPDVQPQPTAVPAANNNSTQPTAVPSTGTCKSPYTVQLGDRLFSIGRLCNVNPYSIAQVNGIFPPYFIYPGQQLAIPGISPGPQPTTMPGGNVYVVKPGDNLFRIALAYGRTMQAIAAANGLSNYNLIFVGQTLVIP
jgi:LysM repeat protein